MADAPAYTNYQLSASTLSTMKEAAGNYMPDYGNWRYINPPAKEEEEEEEEEEEGKKKEELDDKSYIQPDPAEVPAETIEDPDGDGEPGTPGSPAEGEWIWVTEGRNPTYNEAWDHDLNGINSMYDSKEDYVADLEDQRAKAEAGDFAYIAEKKGVSEEQAKKDWEKHWNPQTGHWEWRETKAAVAATPGTGSYASAYPKRSPYKMHEGEPHPNTGVRPGSFADPLSGVELKAARQAIIDRGSTSSTHYHAQAKEIVKDIKANMFQQGEDEKTKKDNKTRAHVTMKTLSTGIQNLFGPEGAVENFIGLYDDGNISEGFRNKGVMAKILKGDPDVKLGVTPENNIVLQVQTPQGEMMAISASDINDMSEKAVTQYGFGAKAASGYSALIDAGRSGLPYDSDSVKTESRRLLEELGPNGLASVMGDKGIITDEPLIKHAGEAYWADANVDSWNLIHEAMQTEKGENDLLELGVEALERVAFNKHAMGYAEFQKENNSNPTELSAAELIEKYA